MDTEIKNISDADLQKISGEKAFNENLAPSSPSERTWNKWHFTALWVGMSICVPTYTLGGVLIAFFGLSAGEALWVILLANVIILVPLILNGRAGTKYGIPFPVLLRSSFGVVGSNLPAITRGLIACGWFGIQCLFGGLALDILLDKLLPFWAAMGGIGYFISFFAFMSANAYVVMRGFESIKALETIAAPLLILVGFGLIIWGWGQADMAEVFTTPANRPADAPLLPFFLGGLTAMVGFWATLALNIPDFTRYAKSQKDQTIGQIIGLPVTMFLFSALGVVMTAASASIFGETISDPVSLIGRIDSTFWVVLAMLIIILATISTNAAANMVAPTNDFQNIAPKAINMRRGVQLTALVGTLLVIWEVLRNSGFISSDISVESLYSNWLLTYSSLLGPVAGIMIADFYIVRKQELDVAELYKDAGAYGKYNWAGILAFLIPALLALIAFRSGGDSGIFWLYNYGWFTGATLGFVLYILLHPFLGTNKSKR
ncbi:MAG: NCS1 family nucleobase:cation symporter-1 [Candidatus Portiera sp.]|nr:NCS1 family nucleobase:cation symporter-1 [Portiera sp.]